MNATACRYHSPIVVDHLLEIQNAPNVLIVLLGDFHHFCHLQRLFLKLLLRLSDLVFLLRHPPLQLYILLLEGSR